MLRWSALSLRRADQQYRFLRSVSCCSSRVICARDRPGSRSPSARHRRWTSSAPGFGQIADRRLHIQHLPLSLRLSVRADKYPFCARIAPQLSVLSSNLPRGCLSLSTVPCVQLALAAVLRRELDMFFPALVVGADFVVGRVRRTLRLSLRMVTWSPCAESCSTPAIYGRSGYHPQSQSPPPSPPAAAGAGRSVSGIRPRLADPQALEPGFPARPVKQHIHPVASVFVDMPVGVVFRVLVTRAGSVPAITGRAPGSGR
ncbi:hypothetical protein BANRA_02798 [Klebsiella pneumoniae]|nr:hypothetical protein BANRA_02798 [Klebsiella pneumoniae]